MKTTMKMALVAATMISGTSVATSAHADEATMGKCHGVNACKGKTACSTAEGACQGTNSCAGKGWLLMDEKSCKEKSGRFEPVSKK